jgi:hypothetical protein
MEGKPLQRGADHRGATRARGLASGLQNQLRPRSSLGALTPSEFAAPKRNHTTPPQEGEITTGLYL